jgi:hypothetical protein
MQTQIECVGKKRKKGDTDTGKVKSDTERQIKSEMIPD